MPKTIPVSEEEKRKIREYAENNPDLSSRALGREFKKDPGTIRKILSTTAQPVKEDSLSDEPLIPVDAEDDVISGEWVQKERYVYNGDSDTYITVLKCRPKPLVMSGQKFRSMKKCYSDWDGNPSTINEICRRFAVPRDQFMELKSVHGWSHDSEPFSREEILAREVDDLADDAFQQRRQAVWESFEKKKWHQTKVDAQKWNSLEQNFILPLQDHLSTLIPAYAPPRLNLKTPRLPFAVVTSGGELHYGGSGWGFETGESYSREEAAFRLESTRSLMLEDVADRGKPDKFFYAIGHDFFTIDTDYGTTTKGTPQDTDGTSAQIFSEGLDLAMRDIDCLRSIAPVEIVPVPGNHDRLLTVALLKCFEVAYKNSSDVSVEFSARTRAYRSYGETLLGFGHGDGALKPKDFMATMAKEAPELWANTLYRAFFTGHLHSEVVRELVGGTHYQMPSLRGADRFHERNAYLSDAALASYLVDKSRGVTSTIYTRA